MADSRTSADFGAVDTPAGARPVFQYSFGVFSVDLRTRKLRRGSDVIPLPVRAFDTLALLVAHPGRPIEKNEIIAAVWRDVAVTDDSLIHAISVLRRALGDDPAHPSLIETLPRLGYRFLGTVEQETEPLAAAATPIPNAFEPKPAVKLAPAWMRAEQRPAIVFGLVVLGIVGLAFWLSNVAGGLRTLGVRSSDPMVQLDQTAPAGTIIVSGGVVSPTGDRLTFVALDEKTGETALWARELRSSALVKLPGTARASHPFWSPDGRFIAFFANGKLSAVGLSGESARTIAVIGSTPAGGNWGANGLILFADWTSGIYAVPARGGPVTALTQFDQSGLDFAHAWPQFLPDGRHFMYQLVSTDPARAGVYLGTVGSPDRARLLDVPSPAVYVPPGYLLYVRHDMLMAQGFDASQMKLDGRAVVLARGVPIGSWQNADVISASREVLAFREGNARQRLRITDRSGLEQRSIDVPSHLVDLRVSPDERRLLATSSTTHPPELWIVDLSLRQHTVLEPDAMAPVWAPDGARVAFTARGGRDLFIRRTAEPNVGPVVSDHIVKVLNDWSPNGREIVYSQLDPATKLDLWVWSLSGRPRPLLNSRFNETQARLSPNGRWMAYVSDESGTPEVYVRRYPQLTDVRRISVGGGAQPQWRRDQSELFYLAPDNALIAVPIAGTEANSFGVPQRLFRTSITGHALDPRDSYVAMADGQSFLFEGPLEMSQAPRISVVVNWATGLVPAASRRAATTWWSDDTRMASVR
jgi:eukaryotic-like serine/threonine-protein kinase